MRVNLELYFEEEDKDKKKSCEESFDPEKHILDIN